MDDLNVPIAGLMSLEGATIERIVARHNEKGKAYAVLVLKKDDDVFELWLRDNQGNGIPPRVVPIRRAR